jgi:hypothetical protein
MLCPKCNKDSRVINSRHSSQHRDSGKIPMRFKKIDEQFKYREHKCKTCFHTFQSIELTADVIGRLEARIKERLIAEMVDKLTEN